MKYVVAAGLVISLLSGDVSEARLPEPASVPAELKGTTPHTPSVAPYYLAELVKAGKITPYEAERTEVYMIFRHARRMQDLREADGMSKEERRAYMKAKRELRGNPLKEYADYCGWTMERARDLVNLMHDSDKGTREYERYRQGKK